MLELAKILREIDSLGRERAELVSGIGAELSTADRAIQQIDRDPVEQSRRIEEAKTSWLVAGFDESPVRTVSLPLLPDSHAVVAVDGSQIMMDKHEVALCYLINTAAITLFYGCSERPTASATPFLGYKDEHLTVVYGGKDTRVNDKMVGIRRTTAEYRELEAAAQLAAKRNIPVVALIDGSLILWTLQGEPPDYRKRVLNEICGAMDTAKDLGIPIAGYVSDPGSRDFINSIRIVICEDAKVNCDKCSREREPEDRICNAVEHLKDSMVFGRRLRDGERSVLFSSRSEILKEYGDHNVSAFYLNIGEEIARIEIPQWVAHNPGMLALVHAVCYDQARKGRGYPVSLSEAHERAVVRTADRKAFYEAIERSFAKHGAKITRSMKRVSKGW
jgi:hypothetical protein